MSFQALGTDILSIIFGFIGIRDLDTMLSVNRAMRDMVVSNPVCRRRRLRFLEQYKRVTDYTRRLDPCSFPFYSRWIEARVRHVSGKTFPCRLFD